MTGNVIIKWEFVPHDLFGQNAHVLENEFEIIQKGIVITKTSLQNYERKPEIINELHNKLYSCCLAACIFTNQDFKLYSPTIELPNGSRIISCCFDTQLIIKGDSSLRADFIVTDKFGNILFDSWETRIKQRERYAKLTDKYLEKDIILKQMIESWRKSLKDKEKFLVHIYEIRDVLSRKFEKKAITILNLSKSDWNRLGFLCNEAPLKEGRHSGRHVGSLRNATGQEHDEAKKIARSFIKSYLDYLDQNYDSNN